MNEDKRRLRQECQYFNADSILSKILSKEHTKDV